MKTKKLLSIVMVLIIAITSIAIAVPTASGVTVRIKKVATVPVYKSITNYVNNYQVGKPTLVDKTSGSGNWEGTYSFTLNDDAYVYINYAFSEKRNYGYRADCECKFYSDAYLGNELKMDEAQDKSYYKKLGKGTYYVNAKTTYDKPENFALYIGQINKNHNFADVKYIRTNSDNTVTYKIISENTPKTVIVYDHGFTDILTTRVCGERVFLNDEKEFVFDYKENNKDGRFSVCIEDAYGYETMVYVKTLNKYTAKIEGLKNKYYTGKAVKQSELRVKVGDNFATYRVSYKNNIRVGTATITFTGRENTVGSMTRTFKILPTKVSSTKFSIKGNRTTLKWGTSKGAKNYVIQKKFGKAWKTIKTVSNKTHSYITTVGKGNTYFRVYGTTKVGNSYYNSPARIIKIKK